MNPKKDHTPQQLQLPFEDMPQWFPNEDPVRQEVFRLRLKADLERLLEAPVNLAITDNTHTMISSRPLEELVRDLNGTLPEGLEIGAARYLPRGAPSLSKSIRTATFRVDLPGRPAKDREALQARLEEIMEADELLVERKRGEKLVEKDVRAFIRRAELTGGEEHLTLELSLDYTPGGSISLSRFS